MGKRFEKGGHDELESREKNLAGCWLGSCHAGRLGSCQSKLRRALIPQSSNPLILFYVFYNRFNKSRDVVSFCLDMCGEAKTLDSLCGHWPD